MNASPQRFLAAALCAGMFLGSTTAQQGEGAKKKRVRATATTAVRLVPAGKPRATTPEELKKRHAAKLAEPFTKNAAWITDYDKARAKSKATGKRIFAYFTRSYAP